MGVHTEATTFQTGERRSCAPGLAEYIRVTENDSLSGNYLAFAVENIGDGERLQAELGKNIATAALEFPLAMIGAPISYQLEYAEDSKDFVSVDGYSMRSNYENAINNAPESTPRWELARRHAELASYKEIIHQAETLAPGDSTRVIEFSESPTAIAPELEAEAFHLGYFGAGQTRETHISKDEAGSIQAEVTIRWFPGGYLLKEVEELSLHGIVPGVAGEGLLAAPLVAEINPFELAAEEFSQDVAEIRPVIQDYIARNLLPEVNKYTREVLVPAACQLVGRGGLPSPAELRQLNWRTDLFIAGIQMELRSAIEQALSPEGLNPRQRLEFGKLSEHEKIGELVDMHAKVIGCGFNIEAQGGWTSKLVPAGAFDKVFRALMEGKHDYNCSNCGTHIAVADFVLGNGSACPKCNTPQHC